jgi:glyoxylase-like metal-dependent hydrolase (beta-lactamase superfamily II)
VASIDYKVTVIKNGIFPSNTYILTDLDSNLSIIIDPGLDIEELKKAESGLNPVAVLATHGHFDHIGHATYFQKKYNIPFYLHEEDAKLSRSANFYLKIAKLDLKIETPVPDHFFRGKTSHLSIKKFDFSIHQLPGHTPGSCIIEYKDVIFSGDICTKRDLASITFREKTKINCVNRSKVYSRHSVMML